MQTLLEAATHIVQEIEKTRQHLSNLEQALQGLRPLITMDAPTNALSYSEPVPMGTVEDASIILPVRKKRASPKAKAKTQTKTKANATAKSIAKKASPTSAGSGAVPATGASVWLKALGRKRLTHDQLTQSALQLLKLDVESKAVVRNRAGAWLNDAVKKGLVSSAPGVDGLKTFQVTKS